MESPNIKYSIEIVQANLTDKESWVKAIRGCRYVYHVASPFPGSGSELTLDEQQERIIKPAVDGTRNVLQAVAEVGGVKRVVVTSSMAAISCGLLGHPDKPIDYKYSEKDWSVETSLSPYELSKKKAEEVAWEFVEKLEEDKKFELAVVNPGYVQGPLLSASSGAGTQVLCSSLLAGKIPAIPDVYFLMVDVRDVVALHKAAMETPDAAGKRFLAVSENMSMKEIATVVKGEFQQQGYSVSLMPLPKFGLWIFKFFDKTAKEMYRMLGKRIAFDNERMKSLGVTPRPIKQTILDTCYSLIELGAVEKKPRYRGASSDASSSTTMPVETSKRAMQDETVETSKPDETAETNETGETAEAAKPDETPEIAEPGETVETDKPDETAETDKPEETAETAKPDNTAETAKPPEKQPDETPETAKTAETAKPEETAETAKPEETAETAKPEETAETAKPEETAETAKPDAETAKPETTETDQARGDC